MIRSICFGFFLVFAAHAVPAETPWHAGFSRIDVTPSEPVRMSGYGSRDHASEGIDTPLYARAIALKHRADGATTVLLSIDNIGLPGDMTRQIAQQLQQTHLLSREQIVFCSTHTHCGPDLVSELSNIFSKALSPAEKQAGLRYRRQLVNGILQAVDQSMNNLEAVHLHYAVGEANFAANRRVLKDGRWSGFGLQPDGPVDHSVPTLRVTDANGEVKGVVFNYACHCTTLGGEHYRINGDWAGYATSALESKYPNAVAMCTIGCGADANPNPRGLLDAAKIHGRTLCLEVIRTLEGNMQLIDQPLDARFDYAAASFELPTQEELESRREGSDIQTRRHAKQMLDILKEHGRLPATYPIPIQTWQFGTQLTMVFLGGEVVVDYAHRLKKELADPDLWVTAYANDVMGYIPSERMRGERGYEYDRSGIYYNLPGPWAAGTEDQLISRIHDVLSSRGRSKPIPAKETIEKFDLAEDFQIELVAAEPLIEDPVNIAFDQRGRLWVVEMGDYPEGENGGRIKVLVDHNQDGRFDQATTFLDELAFPTGVFPWQDGVLICSAPDVLFARDIDGDDRADQVEKLYTGFRLANPQHRISGFSYGLDHSLHLSSGDNLGEITSMKTGKSINASGHDIKIWPDSGQIAATSGRTQFIRSRNDWGHWFGNDNSRPMYHFPIDDIYLERNHALKLNGGTKQLFVPPVAPPVFPKTIASERFNDLYAANRFTSACSAIVARSPIFALDANQDVAFICEPVHNLVHRAILVPEGSSYRAERGRTEETTEFLASADPWFRPTRALIGPDGNLYVADMYRETIEHPEWIPDAWQAQLDLRAGSDRGRIYRITKSNAPSTNIPLTGAATTTQLVTALTGPIGASRDLAQQWLLERDDPAAWPQLTALATDPTVPHAQVHALSILNLKNKLDIPLLTSALQTEHAGVLITAIRLAEQRINTPDENQILQRLEPLATHPDSQVRLQLALTSGQSKAADATEILLKIIREGDLDHWLIQAISSSAGFHAEALLEELFAEPSIDQLLAVPTVLLNHLLVTAASQGIDVTTRFSRLFETTELDMPQQLQLAACFTTAVHESGEGQTKLRRQLQPLYKQAKHWINDPNRDLKHRHAAINLLGIGLGSIDEEKQLLLRLISPQTPLALQQDAVARLSQLGDVNTCNLLISRWSSMSDTVRSQCVGQILQRRNWTEILLNALEQGTLDSADLSPAAKQQLRQTGSRSMRVRAARLVATNVSLGKRELIRQYENEMPDSGNQTRGSQLFKKHCAVCHATDNQGAAIGASLENLTDRSVLTLLTAILDPNRSIDPKYQSFVVRTTEERILMGIIEQEAGQSITLAHSDGRRTTLRRDEITEMKNTSVSLMPEGLQEVLSPSEMRDLIEYLQKK